MSCGCGAGGSSTAAAGSGGAVCTLKNSGRVVPIVWPTRAYMCAVCPERRGDSCGAAPEPVLIRIRVVGNSCPLNRFPDRHGLVWLSGLRFMGVPRQIRWSMVRAGKLSASAALPGCGCLYALKLAWVRLIKRGQVGRWSVRRLPFNSSSKGE